MFLRKIKKKQKNNKIYTSVYLAESYRENGKVRHRHLANFSKLPKHILDDLARLLKGKNITSIDDLNLSQGKSFGAIFVISEIAKRLGIKQALGNSKAGKLALFQIAGRIIARGSRHYLASEWANLQAIKKVFNLDDFNHNDLYSNLHWLSKHQEKIEQKIFTFRNNNQKIKNIYLYDVTSSYLEGDKNELAAYGYSRDKKKGKKQIVIGLLTDDQGYPVSVEVFKGNTGDTQTVSNQLEKLQKNFGVERVIFVGDKGMIKSNQIKEIQSDKYKWNYLTTITKEQIRTLINKDVFQIELFTDEIIEIQDEANTRYILHRNPMRAEDIEKNRQSKIDAIKDYIAKQNVYLQEHKKARTEVAIRKINEKIAKLKLKSILEVTVSERVLQLFIDEQTREKIKELDGCYVVKTDVPKEDLDTKTAHDRYKDLSKVEFAFRTMKTTLEEIRPIFVRKEESTRGHVFIVMLSYMIVKYITEALSELKYTRKYIFENLDKINYLEYVYQKQEMSIVPKKLLPDQEKIIKMLNIELK